LKNRTIKDRLTRLSGRKYSRIIVLTGARQTGKTTLIKETFPEMAYISVEDPTLRSAYSRIPAAEWIGRYPAAIIDEVQKTPSVIESIKAAVDADDTVKYILLGSSQILLLSRVKESLAGRSTIVDLWPLTIPEMLTDSWSDPVIESRLIASLRENTWKPGLFNDIPARNVGFTKHEENFKRYLHFGGMPVVSDPELDDEERLDWLKDYQRTYLERDVADLARLNDLEPFSAAQKAAADRTGTAINFSELARESKTAPETARRFMRYLELSYQVILLKPYFRNRKKRLTKMPKIHFLDSGVMRSITGRRGEPTGEEFESAVVAEIIKQISNASLNVGFFHLRTKDGREVDLLLELEHGFIAIEIKRSEHAHFTDARHLRNLDTILDKPLLCSMIISMDREIKSFGENIYAVPAAWLFAPSLDQV